MSNDPGWLHREQWRGTQSALSTAGADVGLTDGVPGERTRKAVEQVIGWARDSPSTVPPPPADYGYGGPSIIKGVDRDPSKLVPSFAVKVGALMQKLRDAGFDPLFWEGYRSLERAKMLAKRGTGIVNSLHCYGGAADIVDGDNTHWQAPPGFWLTLRTEARLLGLFTLTRGGKPRDFPHVQMVRPNARAQNRFRAMSDDERRALVA